MTQYATDLAGITLAAAAAAAALALGLLLMLHLGWPIGRTRGASALVRSVPAAAVPLAMADRVEVALTVACVAASAGLLAGPAWDLATGPRCCPAPCCPCARGARARGREAAGAQGP